MFLLNLSFAQFAGLLTSVGAVVVALYLLDRSRRRQVVATLRFWVAAEQPAVVSRRKRIQQPWSLLLQLLSIALLLLAIGQLRLGSRGAVPFDHVLILETSAWMAAKLPVAKDSPRNLMEDARARARSYVHALPSADRVMLVRADALATPATVFESSRKKLEEAIAGSEPGSTALNLDQVLEFARGIQSLSARRAGEIVFVGSGRISERESAAGSSASISNLRILPIADVSENCGLRKMGLRRSAVDPSLWEIFVSVRNYGLKPQVVSLALQFGGAPVGSRALSLPPGEEREALFEYRTRAAGLLEARLLPRDAFPDDNRAVLELPQQKILSVVVYSREPDLLRPILEANTRVSAAFKPVSEYKPKPDAGLMILDRFQPPSRPAIDSIWIDPPPGASPIPLRKRIENAKLTRWHSEHPLGEGLRTRDLTLESAAIFEAAPSDIKIAEVDGGPVIVARPSKPKIVAIGFHPSRSAMRYELATPLLFANTLRWIAPDIFRRWELIGGSVGTVNLTLEPEVKTSDVRIVQENGRSLPFTVRDRSLHFFSGNPGTVRVSAADRDLVYSLTLPELAESKWEPPAGVKRGVPTARDNAAGAIDLWRILAILGAAGLLLEWILFGRFGRRAMKERAAKQSFAEVPRVAVAGRNRT